MPSGDVVLDVFVDVVLVVRFVDVVLVVRFVDVVLDVGADDGAETNETGIGSP